MEKIKKRIANLKVAGKIIYKRRENYYGKDQKVYS